MSFVLDIEFLSHKLDTLYIFFIVLEVVRLLLFPFILLILNLNLYALIQLRLIGRTKLLAAVAGSIILPSDANPVQIQGRARAMLNEQFFYPPLELTSN